VSRRTEEVAETLHQPLYYISGGELGKDMKEIETLFKNIFSRIARWEAVLLFDKADTFMAKRKDDALDRNTMISGEY
jgi:hypothetical protein